MCYTAAPAFCCSLFALSSQRYCLFTPFPAFFPRLPHICDPTPGPRPGEAASIPIHCFPGRVRSPSCPARNRSPSRDLPPQSHSTRGWASRPSAQAPSVRAPSRQRASHVTASQARSACSRSSVYFPPFLPTWSLLETERSLPTLWRRKSKLQNWSLGRREALPGEAGLGPGPGISADKY